MQLHSSASSCFIFWWCAFYLSVPMALENICVHKSSSAGLCVSEAAQASWVNCGLSHREGRAACHWALGARPDFFLWWNTRSCSASCDFWSFLSVHCTIFVDVQCFKPWNLGLLNHSSGCFSIPQDISSQRILEGNLYNYSWNYTVLMWGTGEVFFSPVWLGQFLCPEK